MNQTTATESPSAPNERLSQSILWAYCTPGVAANALGMMFSVYLMKYSTDVLLIAPAAMGAIFAAGRIWDAISDPLAGYFSDRSTARRGRRRSWMFASALPAAVTIVMVWSPPASLSGSALVLWMAVAMLAYETAMTCFYVPYGALGMELTQSYHERTRLFAYRHFVFAVGMPLGLGGVYLVRTASDPRVMAFGLTVLGGAALAGLIFWCTARLPERREFQGRGAVGVRKAFVDVFRNPHGRLLLIVFSIETFGGASVGMLAPYVMEYVVLRPDQTEIFILFYAVPQLALTPLWIRLSRRFGKKALWLGSLICSGLGFGLIFFIGEESLWHILIIVALLGIGGGCGNVVAPAIQADVIDYDEYISGERKEGAYIAIWNFVRKAAGGVTAGVTGFVLQWVDFAPNLPQTEETKFAMLTLIGLLPAGCYLIGAVLFARFDFNEEEHRRVVAVLEERRAARGDVGG